MTPSFYKCLNQVFVVVMARLGTDMDQPLSTPIHVVGFLRYNYFTQINILNFSQSRYGLMSGVTCTQSGLLAPCPKQ